MCVCVVDLTQHLLWWWKTEAKAGGVHTWVVLWMDHGTSILQWAHEFPETYHFLLKSLNILLALLLGNRGRVHFEVENSGFDGIIVSLRQKDKDQFFNLSGIQSSCPHSGRLKMFKEIQNWHTINSNFIDNLRKVHSFIQQGPKINPLCSQVTS